MTARAEVPIRVAMWLPYIQGRVTRRWAAQCHACPMQDGRPVVLDLYCQSASAAADVGREHLREKHPELCSPRPFRVGHVLHPGDPEPPEGTIVLDACHADEAWRSEGGEWATPGFTPHPWSTLLEHYGPVTVVHAPPAVTS